MDHVGQADLFQQRQAGVIAARRMHDDTVYCTACLEAAIRIRLVLCTDTCHHHVVAVRGIGFPRPGHEIPKDRVHHFRRITHGNHVPNTLGQPGGEALCPRIGAVGMRLRSLNHAGAGFFRYLGIAVQRPTDRGLTETQQ